MREDDCGQHAPLLPQLQLYAHTCDHASITSEITSRIICMEVNGKDGKLDWFEEETSTTILVSSNFFKFNYLCMQVTTNVNQELKICLTLLIYSCFSVLGASWRGPEVQPGF